MATAYLTALRSFARHRVRDAPVRRSSTSANSHAFNAVSAMDAQAFERICGAKNVLDDNDSRTKYGTDWLRQHRRLPVLVLRPGARDEVAAIVRHCNERRIAIVPQGGNTGLVGGSVPYLGCEIVLGLERLNRITGFDEDSGIVTAQAGVVLEQLDDWLAQRGYAVPLDLGAKGSCQIGGNVSTAAAGLRFVRYGSLRGSVCGVAAVTGGGQTIDLMSGLRKDAVGYDLKQLFIGSEGTLGIVTDVAIQAVPRPAAAQVAMLGLSSYEQVRTALRVIRSGGSSAGTGGPGATPAGSSPSGAVGLGEVLSAVEFIDGNAMRISGAVLGRAGPPLDPPQPGLLRTGDGAGTGGSAGSLAPTKMDLSSTSHPSYYPYYMLVEAAGADPGHDADKMNRLLEHLLTRGLAHDGVLASSTAQARQLWKMREDTPVGLAQRGWVFKYDVSLKLPEFPQIVAEANERLRAAGIHGDDGPGGPAAAVHAVGYGHLADGNLHLNVTTPIPQSSTGSNAGLRSPPSAIQAVLEPWVYEWVLNRGGSVSAEHGLGVDKAKWLPKARSEGAVEIMRALKATLDPRGILNPGKVLQ